MLKDIPKLKEIPLTNFCSVSKKKFSPGSLRNCPHPETIRRYGENNRVCWYVCNKCKYKVTVPMMGGLKCGYGKEKNDESI